MTIRGIRNIQILCLISVSAFGLLLAASLVLALLGHSSARWLGHAVAGSGLLAALLFVVLGQLRCPVCRTIFIGRRHRHYFTPTCRNCGRRAGDTG